MDSFVVEDKGVGEAYIAPDPDFISAISFFSSSLPWDRFEKFFKSKNLVGLNGEEQLILLRFLVVQELLCLNDTDLLRWLKNQFYLFSFLQPEFKPRLPTLELLQCFRKELETIGLLEPFRKHCQHIIHEHSIRFPAINTSVYSNAVAQVSEGATSPQAKSKDVSNKIDFTESLLDKSHKSTTQASDKTQLLKRPSFTKQKHDEGEFCNHVMCENCGSHDFIKLKSSQEASSLPDIRFIRCRICGHTIRDNN